MKAKKCKYCNLLELSGMTTEGEIFYENAEEFNLRRYGNGVYSLVCVGDYGHEHEVTVFNCPWCGRKFIKNEKFKNGGY